MEETSEVCKIMCLSAIQLWLLVLNTSQSHSDEMTHWDSFSAASLKVWNDINHETVSRQTFNAVLTVSVLDRSKQILVYYFTRCSS